MYLQRERRSPVCAVSAAKSAVIAGCARVLCEREGGWRVGAAAQVRCVSVEVLHERCAVHGAARCGGRCGSRGRCGKKGRARGLAHGSGEPASRFFCGALQLELVGARCAAPAALLRCESPVPHHPGRVHAACAKANERAARGSQGVARVLGTGGSGGGGPLAKVQRRGAASWRPGEERGTDTVFCAPFFLHRTKKHGS